MNKLGEAAAFLLLLSTTGATAQAVADDPFEYQIAQVVYVETESFYTKYSTKGVLAGSAMEYDYQLARTEQTINLLKAEQNLLETQELAEADVFEQYQVESDAAIAALWPYVGETPYGFGDTPNIWDCSGLTKWYLEQRGIQDIVHSATAQARDYRSTIVDAPIPGDLVAFQRYGSSEYFHIGVYVGGGMMIHAANPAKDTSFQQVQSFAESENSKVAYIRY
tara:strand:+ start:30 stop:695 length:666 start_codon:yes stop_codon:yes gene_type:complete